MDTTTAKSAYEPDVTILDADALDELMASNDPEPMPGLVDYLRGSTLLEIEW